MTTAYGALLHGEHTAAAAATTVAGMTGMADDGGVVITYSGAWPALRSKSHIIGWSDTTGTGFWHNLQDFVVNDLENFYQLR